MGPRLPPSTTRPPLPAGSTPSEIAKQVCQEEAQAELASALGERAHVSVPTWEDHRYACTYTYPTGSFGLSVKELSSWSETYAYYDALAGTLGKARDLENLGQGAFQTTDGSVVVRKDWKVLLVDNSGSPPTVRGPGDQLGVGCGDRRRRHPRLLGRGLTGAPQPAQRTAVGLGVRVRRGRG